MRSSSIYFDKQQRSMFWLDLSSDRYSTGQPWQLPSPSGGLLQQMDENEVSSMLWTIAQQSSVTTSAFYNALAAPKMNTSPWGRGYTWHYWSQLDSQGRPLNPLDTGISRPALPDFLDALVCGGVSTSAVDMGTIPATQYPFPSTAPLCQ
jgi:hypothetical protein